MQSIRLSSQLHFRLGRNSFSSKERFFGTRCQSQQKCSCGTNIHLRSYQEVFDHPQMRKMNKTASRGHEYVSKCKHYITGMTAFQYMKDLLAK